MTKQINIDGKTMTIRASALLPKLYRFHFGRDIIKDMMTLNEAQQKAKENGEQFGFETLELFENVAWLFLKMGGEDVGENPDEWLDSLDGPFSVYEVLPEIMSLWQVNLHQTAKPKKK